MAKVIVVHGTPGSGKTTQAHRFKERYPSSVEHPSIGNHLRAISVGSVSSHFKPDIDRQVADLVESKPPSHEIVNAVVFEFINQCPSMATVLLDGYPRFIEQLGLFFNSLNTGGHVLKGAVHLQISRETSMLRLNNRGVRTGENQVNTDLIVRRFDEYERSTLPVIDTLKKRSSCL